MARRFVFKNTVHSEKSSLLVSRRLECVEKDIMLFDTDCLKMEDDLETWPPALDC